MKYFNLAVPAVYLFASIPASHAQQRPFGLGLMIGEPAGISAKMWTSDTNAFDFGLGWSILNYRDGSKNGFHFHADYIIHSFKTIGSTGQFPLYYGIGGRFNSSVGRVSSFAVRGVIGIAWIPAKPPIDIFLEAAPSLELTPAPGFVLEAAVGLRYFF
ncbi:MAG: hypothetical protein CVV24_04680 [Ignavibacteriae bacterium HGW-Ignavibacteriae-3]|nr:MAG: hypothetical protein CVV24_04680 [Ignavibacteriae bacterium HGW-Ignavibacteriae-3]